MDAQTLKSIDALKDQANNLAAEGHIIDAIHAASEWIDACKNQLADDPESRATKANAYELRADLLRQSDACEQACDDYIHAIESIGKRDDCLIQLGRLHAGLGAAHAALGESDAAARQWQRSMDCFEKNDPPAVLDVAAMANNFGFLKKAAGEYNAAENAFLKAMEILHAELGEDHEETATVASNLGTLYHEAGHFEPARKMHAIAAKARSMLLGNNHPDTARSNADLGVALAKTGNHTAARKHLEMALNAYDSLGREYHRDMQDVAKHYCDVLRKDGELSMAEAVTARVENLLGSKPVAA